METVRKIGSYEVESEIGKGGMGVVYEAVHRELGRKVALKVLRSGFENDVQAYERFRREAKAASALDHPHICTVFDIGETPEGQLFIAMAYCPGETLKERILRGPMPIEDAVDIHFATVRAAAAEEERRNP